MVTLQILVLSFLVRIQVAQLKRSSLEGRFFCLYALVRAWREMFVPNILRYWVGVMMQASTPTQYRMVQAPLSPLLPLSLSSIVVPPDSHFVLVEPI